MRGLDGRMAMVGILRTGPSGPTSEPGIDDIAELVEDFRRAGMTVHYHLAGAPQPVSAATGLGLYRIAQESLANVAKHAPGAEADVRVRVTGEWATVCFANTTSHPVTLCDSGSGIHGMRQRAELLGGSLRVGPVPQGWLTVRLGCKPQSFGRRVAAPPAAWQGGSEDDQYLLSAHSFQSGSPPCSICAAVTSVDSVNCDGFGCGGSSRYLWPWLPR